MLCCEGMKSLVANAGQRGMSAIVYQRGLEFRFNLQSRADSYDDELPLVQQPMPNSGSLTSDGVLTLSTNMGLRFCPFCGKELQRLIKPSTKQFFEGLAQQHKKLDERLY